MMKFKRYGIPYKGSKNAIARDIVDFLPRGERLVDMFCGGCAVAHVALLAEKYNKVVINDLDGKFPKLFRDCIDGKLPSDYDRFISREEFHRLKSTDAIVACVWSFGNNCDSYLWGADIEKSKGIAHKMLTAKSIEERYGYYREFIKYLLDNCVDNRLQQIERLQGLQRLQGYSNLLEISSLDYREVEIFKSDIIYCDPPYKGTDKYAIPFDSDLFWQWAREKSEKGYKIFVSEYKAPEDFVSVWSKEKRVTMNKDDNTLKKVEHLFCHKSLLDKIGGMADLAKSERVV